MKILIKGGRVIDPKTKLDKNSDVYIEDGIISKIADEIEVSESDVLVIDAKGKVVAPGLIDMHCHLRDPGYEYKEDIETGTRSAAKGGFTSVACMPNTNPVIDNAALAQFVINKAKAAGYANVYPIGSISKGLKGQELADIGELKHAGAVGVSDDGCPVSNSSLMRKGLEYASMFDTLVISHCEELDLLDDGVMNEGATSTSLGLKGINSAVEEIQVARDVILSEKTNAPLHICHVSTTGSVEIVRQAKKRGIKVTCETCPHYFTLTEEACIGFDTNAKMNPPLRTKKDLEAILEGLADGTIDAIATDHAPHHIDEKNLEFSEAKNGIVGFETAFGLGYTYLVKPGVLTLGELLSKMTVVPATLLGISRGELSVGSPADVTIFDIENEYTVDVNSFASKSKNSPYDGYKLYGKAVYTIVDGKIVLDNEKLTD